MNITYSEKLPDYGDVKNGTGKHPGYTVEINDQDAGVGLLFEPVGASQSDPRYGVWMTTEKAEQMLASLKEAIDSGKRFKANLAKDTP